MTGDKTRIFINLHFEKYISRSEDGIRIGGVVFHWAVWAQGKNSKGPGYAYEVVELDSYSNMPSFGGWIFEHRQANWTNCGMLMLRILVGKLPLGTTYENVRDALATIPLPRPGVLPVENSATWTRQAILMCQELRWIEQFDVDTFMNNATQLGAKCLHINKFPSSKSVANFTNRRLEEKVDIAL
ncbi:hypothetical protein DV737_g2048, partial [Chaetothyriales sp. CBS 132003]